MVEIRATETNSLFSWDILFKKNAIIFYFICRLGRICLDILKDKWSPALQIRTVLLSIQALLSAPNPDDPLANDVAELWKVNESEAIRNAKEWTRRYAMDNWSQPCQIAHDKAKRRYSYLSQTFDHHTRTNCVSGTCVHNFAIKIKVL